MVCRNERLASKSARSRGKKKSFEMVVEGCWDDLTVEYQPPSALSKRICRSLQRATIINSPTVRTGFFSSSFPYGCGRQKVLGNHNNGRFIDLPSSSAPDWQSWPDGDSWSHLSWGLLALAYRGVSRRDRRHCTERNRARPFARVVL